MSDFREYLKFVEKYIHLAEDEDNLTTDLKWLLIPSILLSWIAIESFVNNMLDDFSSLPEDMFELHERAFLLEQSLRFASNGENLGKFILTQTEYRRLEDKIFFLIAKFSNKRDDFKGGSLWQNFEEFKNIRNSIMHPRKEKEIAITIDDTKRFLETAKGIIKFVSKNVWGNAVDF